ncbi:MAG TPA: suppressor of fused domain protein [Jatrophihabitantaceae bacterium]
MDLPVPLASVDTALREHFGAPASRASVTFVGVDPIEVLRFEPIPRERAYLSLGMSRHPMTAAQAAVRSADGVRAELMLHVRDAADEFADVWRRVAVLAAAPAVEGVVYVPGMTVDLGQPLVSGSLCTGVLVVDGPVGPIATPAGPVDILQVVPAATSELAWCRVHGSAALRARWAERRTDLLDLARAPVRLN